MARQRAGRKRRKRRYYYLPGTASCPNPRHVSSSSISSAFWCFSVSSNVTYQMDNSVVIDTKLLTSSPINNRHRHHHRSSVAGPALCVGAHGACSGTTYANNDFFLQLESQNNQQRQVYSSTMHPPRPNSSPRALLIFN